MSEAAEPAASVAKPARLSAVRRTGLLDTPSEDSFDGLTSLAAKMTGAPTAVITLVDATRDFLKSRHGLPEALESVTQLTGRTLCHFTIGGGKPFVVDDVQAHPDLAGIEAIERFGVRAYAGAPLIDKEGNALGVLCAVDFAPRHWTERDVEVLVELARATMREVELAMALTEARKLLEAREQMMAVVAHDLRTPLSVVTMYSQLLARQELPEKATNMIERLRRTVEGMGQLIKSMLDMSQIEAQAVVLNRQPAAPGALVDDVIGHHTADFEREGLALVSRCAPNLPVLSTDYERVMRVFDNLVSNALVFSRRGGTVTISADPVDAGVRFAVTDTGEGIPKDELQGLLDRFWEMKVHERRSAGFGLAIAGGLVRSLGGNLDAWSAEGVGSEFGFTLPVASVQGII